MYKMCLLSLVIHSSLYSMLGQVLHCVRRLPLTSLAARAALPQADALTSKRRFISDDSSLSEFIKMINEEASKMNPQFAAALKLTYREVKINMGAWDADGEAKQKIAQMLPYIAAKARLFRPSDDDMLTAVRSGNRSLVEHLLDCGANPNAGEELRYSPTKVKYNHALDIAVRERNKELIFLLSNAGGCIVAHHLVGFLSSSDIKTLLQYPQNRRVLWHDLFLISDLIKFEGFSFDDLCFKGGVPKKEHKAEILKKIMLFVHAGVAMSLLPCDEYGTHRDMMRLYKGNKDDWTKGEFPDLVNYLYCVRIIQDDRTSSQEKDAARAAIEGIMKEYGIEKEDVTIVLREKSESRVQEAA